jgi:hypothetical protein
LTAQITSEAGQMNGKSQFSNDGASPLHPQTTIRKTNSINRSKYRPEKIFSNLKA